MNRKEKDLIESLKRLFSKVRKVSSIEVLPKCIASCSFTEVIPVLFSNCNGFD